MIRPVTKARGKSSAEREAIRDSLQAEAAKNVKREKLINLLIQHLANFKALNAKRSETIERLEKM